MQLEDRSLVERYQPFVSSQYICKFQEISDFLLLIIERKKLDLSLRKLRDSDSKYRKIECTKYRALKIEIDQTNQGRPKKKHTIFYDIESKGGQVAVSKPDFLNIRNYDIYIRRVGKRLIY